MIKLWTTIAIFATLNFTCLTGCIMAVEKNSLSRPQTFVLCGKIVTGGVICPLLLCEDGETIALDGVRPGQFEAGTRLELEGIKVNYSPCQQGKEAFRVDRILSINSVSQ